MIIVTIRTRSQSIRFDAIVESPKQLISLIMVLESADHVNDYKVTEPEIGLIKDLKHQYGFGDCHKFVTEFF